MNKNKIKGFTLTEVIIVIAVFGIIISALFPKISRIIDDSKINRAQTEVDNIGQSILAFSKDMSIWPAGKGDQLGGKSSNFFKILISGSQGEGTIGANIDNIPSSDPSLGWSAIPISNYDYFDNHLRLNNPGNCRGYTNGTFSANASANRYFPVIALPEDSTTFRSRTKETRSHWNGPYMDLITYDPWGNRYLANLESAFSTSPNSNLVSFVISSGPDNIISTDANADDEEFISWQPMSDDLTFVIIKRRGRN